MPNVPRDSAQGEHSVRLEKTIFIEQSDFREVHLSNVPCITVCTKMASTFPCVAGCAARCGSFRMNHKYMYRNNRLQKSC